MGARSTTVDKIFKVGETAYKNLKNGPLKKAKDIFRVDEYINEDGHKISGHAPKVFGGDNNYAKLDYYTKSGKMRKEGKLYYWQGAEFTMKDAEYIYDLIIADRKVSKEKSKAKKEKEIEQRLIQENQILEDEILKNSAQAAKELTNKTKEVFETIINKPIEEMGDEEVYSVEKSLTILAKESRILNTTLGFILAELFRKKDKKN